MNEHNPGKYLDRTTEFDTLEGVKLSVIAIDSKSYEHQMTFGVDIVRRKKIIKFVSGMCYELLLCLQHSLKFSYKAVKSEQWIDNPLKTRKGKGMASLVIDGTADISITQSSMVMFTQALPNITYLLPTSSGKLKAIFRQPDAYNTRDIVVPSLNVHVIIAFVCTWIAIILSFKILQYATRRLHIIGLPQNDSEAENNEDYIVPWCMGTVTCQGWKNCARAISIRVVLLTVITSNFICQSHYSASLTSILTTEPIPIANFNDLAESSLKIYGDASLPVVMDLVQEVYKDHRGITISSDRKSPQFIRVEKSGSVILNQSAAFITFEDMTKSIFVDQEDEDNYFCDTVSTVSASNGPLLNAMFVKKGSYLKEIFNRKIVIMQESGLTRRINLMYNSKTVNTCPKESKKYRGGLGIQDISTVFIFVGIGISIGLGSVFVENCVLVFQNIRV